MTCETLYHPVCSQLSNRIFYRFTPCSEYCAVLWSPFKSWLFSWDSQKWPVDSSPLRTFSGIVFCQRKPPQPRWLLHSQATFIQGQWKIQGPSPFFTSVIIFKSHPGSRTCYGAAWGPCCNCITAQLLWQPSPTSFFLLDRCCQLNTLPSNFL